MQSNPECVGRYSFRGFAASAVCYNNPLRTGRYVGIMTTRSQFLNLCEVEVYSRGKFSIVLCYAIEPYIFINSVKRTLMTCPKENNDFFSVMDDSRLTEHAKSVCFPGIKMIHSNEKSLIDNLYKL